MLNEDLAGLKSSDENISGANDSMSRQRKVDEIKSVIAEVEDLQIQLR